MIDLGNHLDIVSRLSGLSDQDVPKNLKEKGDGSIAEAIVLSLLVIYKYKS